MKKTLLFLLMLLLFAPIVKAQENESVADTLAYMPETKSLLPEGVRETSGLFFYNGRLWTHNDSGGKPILYGLDTATFEVVQKITLLNAQNKDWEDICTDGEYVYVGDFGNNKGKRKNLRIYTFPIRDIPNEGNTSLTVDSINFRFADQTMYEYEKHKHDFDCESMFATDKYLYMFSKGWATGNTRLYRLPKTPGKHVAEVVNSFDSQGLITGADYDRENGTLVLVGYVNQLWLPFLWYIEGFNDASDELSCRRIEMPYFLGLQAEGICFIGKDKCYFSAETSPTITSRVFIVDFHQWFESGIGNGEK